jgi:hypothetical protein
MRTGKVTWSRKVEPLELLELPGDAADLVKPALALVPRLAKRLGVELVQQRAVHGCTEAEKRGWASAAVVCSTGRLGHHSHGARLVDLRSGMGELRVGGELLLYHGTGMEEV